MRILQVIFAAFLVTIAHPALARADAWTVTQRSGDVRVLRPGLQPASAQLRSALAPGDVVVTGASGRAMLTRGDDYVILAPASRLRLPAEQKQTGFTRLVQQVGTMFYKVRHTGVPHFAVETPMLAAVVKGTTFTVVVDEHRVAVQVTDGLVEVKAASGDATRLVEGGLTVYVGRERPNEIVEMKPGVAGLTDAGGAGSSVQIESSAPVSLTSITDLTGGLVREAPVTPAVTTLVPGSVVVSTPAAPPIASPVPPVDAEAPAAPTVPTDPVVDVLEPLVDPVVDVVDSVVNPVVDVVDPVVDPIVDIVEPVDDPVVEIVDPVLDVEPVVELVEPEVEVVEPVVEVVEPVVEVVEPLVEVAEPVIEVVEPVIEVVEPVVEVVEPVLDPILGPLTGPLL